MEEINASDRLRASAMQIRENRQNYESPFSYVTPDSSRLRSRFAAFDPLRRDEGDLLAGVGPWLPILGISGLGAAALQSEEDERR
jgi:hypothetical protein